MKKAFSVVATAVFLLSAASAFSAAPRRNNYVVFNVKGDCGQEDCIAAVKEAVLRDHAADIVSLDATSLAPHQTVDFKTVVITFKDYKTAPYTPVMQQIANLGYNVISFVIHDTHTGQDVIIPH